MACQGRTVTRLEHVVDRMEKEGDRYRGYREAATREREEDREAAARERREMNKRWGELANKMGTVVEDIVAPSVRRLARDEFGCGDLQFFSTRGTVTRSDDHSFTREFDALYVGARAVLLNEPKSSPRIDARAFSEFLQSGDFARYFPQHRELPIVPAFTSLSIPESIVTYLTRRDIYALAMGDQADAGAEPERRARPLADRLRAPLNHRIARAAITHRRCSRVRTSRPIPPLAMGVPHSICGVPPAAWRVRAVMSASDRPSEVLCR